MLLGFIDFVLPPLDGTILLLTEHFDFKAKIFFHFDNILLAQKDVLVF